MSEPHEIIETAQGQGTPMTIGGETYLIKVTRGACGEDAIYLCA